MGSRFLARGSESVINSNLTMILEAKNFVQVSQVFLTAEARSTQRFAEKAYREVLCVVSVYSASRR